ncbi:MAG TPA: hypothetical protein VGE53_00195 [Candidatus Paceibacterota bacterium]
MQEPLNPLPVPAFLAGANVQSVISIILLALAAVWLVYTVVSAYHWLRYGHRSAVAIPALITHVAVSWLLASYAGSGLPL